MSWIGWRRHAVEDACLEAVTVRLRRLPRALAILLTIPLTQCATGYGEQSLTGGYVDKIVEPGIAVVVVTGNGFTPEAKVQAIATLRAAELTLQKRDAPEIFKALKHAEGPLVYRWTRNGDRVTDVVPQF